MRRAPTHLSRREYLRLAGAAVAGVIAAPPLLAAPADTAAGVPAASLQPNSKFRPIYDALAAQMRQLYGRCRVKIDGRELLRPCASSHYNGLWHDDFTWPLIGLRAILEGRPVLDYL